MCLSDMTGNISLLQYMSFYCSNTIGMGYCLPDISLATALNKRHVHTYFAYYGEVVRTFFVIYYVHKYFKSTFVAESATTLKRPD